MKVMATIALEGLKFKAPIGLYPEEKTLKNDIELNVHLSVSTLLKVETIDDTINYEIIYQLIEKEVMVETDLLEDTLQRILNSIKEYCEKNVPEATYLNKIHVQIKKISPPIKGKISSVWIEDELVSPMTRKKNAQNAKNSSDVTLPEFAGVTL